VVPSTGDRWERIIELRVEDHPEPLIELRRLVGLHDAYVLAGEGDRLSGEGDHLGAAAKYMAAYERAPGCVELEFWAGLGLVQIGETDRGIAHIRSTIERHGGWGELLARLGPDASPAAATARGLLDVSSAPE
jgi:uncharacterized Ntn-hydrolase superfamily protein